MIAVVCVLFGAWLALRVQAWWKSRRGRAIHERGKRGERDAERLLQARGYRIVERQAPWTYELRVNGETERVSLSLDFIVERSGEKFVAEVKTGAGTLISNVETRRQLLEYQLATDSRPMLLVDPEAGTITEVSFPIASSAPESQRESSAWTVLALIALLAALGWYALRFH